MKKIVNNKLYDTTTAKKIVKYDNHKTGYNFIKEELYRKKTGEYFLFCEGGTNTKYAEPCGDNQFDYGYQFIPLSLSEAKQWAVDIMDADDYMEEFGKVEE